MHNIPKKEMGTNPEIKNVVTPPLDNSIEDLVDNLVDNWIVDVPYFLKLDEAILDEVKNDINNIDTLRKLYQASKRYYFIHENTIVYTKNKPVQLYTLLRNKIQEKIYLFPQKERLENSFNNEWYMNYFMVLNPYSLGENDSIRLNGEKQFQPSSCGSMYRFLWELSLKTSSFSGESEVNYIHKITNEEKPIKFNRSGGPCLNEFGNYKPYEIDTDSMVKACSIDLFSVEKRNLNIERESSKKFLGEPEQPRQSWQSRQLQESKHNPLAHPRRTYEPYVENLIPRFPYLRYSNKINPNPPNVHWGQVKLLFSEIEFLMEYGNRSATSETAGCNTPSVVVYAGAASGQHIPILAQMFPRTLFILYDPEDFSIRPSSTIIIRKEYFTDEIAALYSGLGVLFISDIRRTELDPLKFEQLVEKDNETQKKWAEIMNPHNSLFKFRLPFLPGNSKYLDGIIKLQCFAPPTSAETRLVPFRNNKGQFKEKLYSHANHENQLFYFNIKYRNRSFLDLDPVFGINYDTFRAYNILNRYIEFIKLVEPSLQNIKIKGIYILGIIFEIEKKLKNDKISRILGL